MSTEEEEGRGGEGEWGQGRPQVCHSVYTVTIYDEK